MKTKFIFKRVLTLVLAVMMLVTAVPVGVFAEPGATGNQSDSKFEIKYDDGSIVRKEDYINETKNLPVVPKKTDNAKKLVANPDMPKLYTVHSDFKVQRGDDLVVAYQPYIATAGDDEYEYTDNEGVKQKVLSDGEKTKINKLVKFPVLDGYTSATPKGETNITYQFIKDKASAHNNLDGYEYKGQFDYKYTPKTSTVKVKHVFQDIKDFNKYTNPDGTITQGTTIIHADGSQATLSEAEIKKHERISTQYGLTGTSLTIQPLPDFETKGYVPEDANINTQVPENPDYFVVEYRYNLARYTVNYDTGEGSPLPTRTLFYNQIIPKLNDLTIKDGGEFLGWMPSVELKGTLNGSEKTFKANEIIKDSSGNAIVDLNNLIYEKDANGNLVYEDLIDPATGKPKNDPVTGKNIKSTKVRTKNSSDTISLIMPAEKLTFTAVWKDKDKADYAVQFWAEKADHADNASLADKYDYIGTRVYKQKATGSRPDLDNEPVKDIVFPDLDQARLQKIWNGEKFYGDKYPYINKFYVYNQALTHEQNKDPKNVSLVKSVSPTGKTVYNIYYDRQVYDLYFTKSNALGKNKDGTEQTFCPEIYVPDGNGGAKLAGGPGNPYHYQARFNQLMLGWPNDAMQTKGFDPGKQSYGWGPNYAYPQWPLHLDTPPYRLNADEFLDMPNYDNWGGYVSQIDKGDGTYIDVKNDQRYKAEPYKALSFGIKQDKDSMPHHMDFWMDGFKDGETIIRYDLYRSKADTNSLTYGHRYSKVQGFTPKGSTIEEGSEENGRVGEDGIDALNNERGEVTPFPNKKYIDMYGNEPTVGQMPFIYAFFNNADSWGDAAVGDAFKENGYIRFKYTRNKYPLRFNYDPSKIKDDSEFNSTNELQTFYEFPLKVLSPELVDDNTPQKDREYFKENPANFLDDPENLQKLGLSDLVFTDTDGKLKVKRPENLSDDMVFKGWALDPAGIKLISENSSEKMPSHPVNLYAKWGDPDTKLGITFDANGGTLPNIDPAKLTQKQRTIKEGDVSNEIEVTYPIKESNDFKKAKFTVIQKQKLIEPAKPTRDGYNFLGWEVLRYKKNANGEYTDELDTTFRDTYKVPELYSFGNQVAAPLYLKAIWVESNLVDVLSYHHFLDENYKENSRDIQPLRGRRVGSYLAAVGSRQNAERFLIPKSEWDKLEGGTTTILGSMLYKDYKELDQKHPRVNSYNQQIKVEPEKIQDPNDPNNLIDNPDAKLNQFHFYYRPFRHREYKVNYLDERGRKDVEGFINKSKKAFSEIKGSTSLDDAGKAAAYQRLLANNRIAFKAITDKYAIIKQETIKNGKLDFDARNYRPIEGWVLDDKPQQQLFFDINKDSSAFFGINETGLDEINFFYKDVRVVETKENDPVPDGYVRVTFKAADGGSFTDKADKAVKEIYYDVVKGLRSQLLTVPQELKAGEKKVEGKYYITPDNGKNFTKWDNQQLLNDDTIIEKDYTFTAQYDWSGVAAKSKGLVKTEAFDDPNNTWTNKFAPTIDELKAQVVKTDANGNEVPLPADATVTIVDDAGNELTQDAIYKKVKELGKFDTNELVRTVVFKAKLTFAGNTAEKDLDIPVTIYKNVYEALTNGDMPKVLKDATTAHDGDLVDVTGDYVKVTVQPTEKNTNKDAKVYYVNKNAWVNIPEVEWSQADKDKTDFLKWTANKANQNETSGEFDFNKRHKFTEDTVIEPKFSDDVVEQKEGEDKPKVPDNFVKVIVDKTIKADLKTGEVQTQTFWVNPTKVVTIPVSKPNGKTIAPTGTNPRQIAYMFKDWTSNETTARNWTDTITAKFTETVTIITANYKEAENIIPYNPDEPITRPDGYVRVKFDAEEGLTLSNAQYYYVKQNSGVKLSDLKNDTTNYGYPKVDEKTGYEFLNWDPADTVIGDTDITVTAKANKLDNVISDDGNHTKPEGYVDVVFVIKTGDETKGSLVGVTKYFVNPTEYVKFNPPVIKANTGYEFGAWNKNTTIPTVYTDTVTTITGNFNDLDAVSLEPKPGYVKVEFTTDGDGGEIVTGQIKEYYVDPNRAVTLTPPTTKADTGYEFDKWSEDTTTAKKYTTPTIVKGTFKELQNIIPSKDPITNQDNAKPSGYVTVTFDMGNHGSSISGETVYYVNPNAGKTLANIDPKPIVTPDTGHAFSSWDKDDTTPIIDDITVTAQYKDFVDVIPKYKDDGTENTKPAGYIEVTFDTNGKGTIKNSTETQKIVFVKPNTAVVLKGYEPEVTANSGYKFSGWSVDLSKATVYNSGDVIKAQYNNLGDIKTTEEPGFVKVEFHTGPEGTLLGDANLWVRPGVALTLPAPIVTPNAGHTFTGWDKPLKVTLPAGSNTYKINAQYDNAGNIILEKDASGNTNAKPKGYVTVTFRADTNGKLDVDKDVITYFVNPDADIMIVDTVTKPDKEIAVPKTEPEANYEFDKWFESIDKTNPIKTDLEHVARFKKKRVTLTYDIGAGTEGRAPINVIVEHGTEVYLATSEGFKKEYSIFDGWKIDGQKYKVGDGIELTKDSTANAVWVDVQNIISYDPVNDPMTRPDGYVRVTFEAEDGLSLTEQKAYYVRKNLGIKLKSLKENTADFGYPAYIEKTGYKFNDWDQNLDTVINDQDIVVKALATKLETVIPEKDKNNNLNKKPEGYKEVSFVIKAGDGTKGSLVGNTKFYVNPTEYVTINPPTTKAETGYVFGAWDQDANIPTVYKDDKTITGSFNGLEYVIPKTKPNESEKPAGYVTVTFVIDPATGGHIVDGETTVYYVKPNTDVRVPQPKTIADTGYIFKNWDTNTTDVSFGTNTTVKGSFNKLKDIIDGSEAKPDGYITVTFDKGEHGKDITGQTVYYVNPNAGKTIGNLTKPTVTPEIGYKANGWDKDDNTPISGAVAIVVKAQYEALPDVIVKTADDDSQKPDGYITVTFDTTNKGRIKNTSMITKKVLFVNPNKAIKLEDKAPGVVPKAGYKFAKWDVSINQEIQYKDGTTITALYNEPENISTTEVYGYVKVEFKAGTNGSLNGTTKYWIKPGVAVNIPEPTVEPAVGYKFDKWDKDLTVTLNAGAQTYEITATYNELDDIISQKNIDGLDRPEGYVTVKFEAKYGTLKGTLVYYVNPNKDIMLLSTAENTLDKADTGYTRLGGTWSEDVSAIKKYTTNTIITFTYKKLDDVIEAQNGVSKPDGYVTVTLIPTDKATDETKAEKIYYVNPKANVTITNSPEGKTETKNEIEYTYAFKGWTVTRGTIASWVGETITGRFIQDTEITARYSTEVKQKDLLAAPIAKENVITPINVEPKAEDLIKNLYDASIPDSKDNLPEGTKFEYVEKPDVQTPGDAIAKVKVTYRNNKTVIVEVPVKVVGSIIPQEGKKKPKNVPSTFVKVTFDPTANGTLEGTKIFWVDPTKEVAIPVKDPIGKGYNVFKGWKIEDEDYNPTVSRKFEQETIVTASYIDSDNIIKFDPKAEPPMARPEGYVKVTFDAQVGLKLTDSKAYYVKKNAGVTLKTIKEAAGFGYPGYDAASGYSFEKWDKADTTEIKEDDIVVNALAKFTPSEPGYRPSSPEIIYRDRIVEKEKIVEKTLNIYGEMDKELRYMQGYNGKFRPYDGLTRAEAAQILANALKADGYRYDANYALSYDDVSDKWYTDAIRVVTQAGVFKGYSDGTFRPQGKITRAEWVATLRRFQDLKEASGNNMMLRSGHWATAEVEAAYEAGWLGVYQDGIAKFDADKPITRQEVAYVSNRAFNRVLDKIYLKRSANTLITYKDVSPSMPLYEDILCASNTLLTDGKYYRANTVDNDLNKFNMVTDGIKIDGKKFQYNTSR